ncbi:TetR/AcrR family transcriptional regulator [Neobacillus novalis]|uniref:TetR/AcrR family transcriptional regulator n=1 Tax=Neobacillus novalis TaxID=220687 RepID=A0AA95S6M2_9BACI|nr:TetR/AcrR family transcriptional regulator [Neobacillus novalis]WHY83835.1 TetR/AcrR family transcriptional regulator [Neobacillus novalis]
MEMNKSENVTRTDRRKARIREQLVAGAMKAFTEVGYMKTTVDDITSRADVGHGTFYHHFKNKQDLLGKLVDELADKVNDYVQPKNMQLSIYERMRYEARGILEYYVNNRSILLALKEAVMVDKQFEGKWLKISESLFKRIEHDIKGSVDKGYCHNINVDVTIRSLTCMFEGYGHYLMTEASGSEEIKAVADSLTDLCYRAIFKTQ